MNGNSDFPKVITKPYENTKLFLTDHPALSVIFFGLIILILYLVVQSFLSLLNEGGINPDSYASLASALASVLLAGLTGVYVVSLKNQNQMIDDQHEQDFKRQKESLRKGLIYEIKSFPESKVDTMDYDDTKHIADFAPKTIFQNNANQIGILTDKEVEAVTAYYTELSTYEEYIAKYSSREAGGNLREEAETVIKSKQQAIEILEQELGDKN